MRYLSLRWSLALVGTLAALSFPAARGDEAPPPPRALAPLEQSQKVTERLRNSLAQLDALRDAQIGAAILWSDGTVQVFGFVRGPEQRSLIEEEGKKALDRETEQKNLPFPVGKVDASPMVLAQRGPLTPLDRVVQTERVLASVPGCLVCVACFSPSAETIFLCGTVETGDHLPLVADLATRVAGVAHVNVRDLIVTDQDAFQGSHLWERSDLYKALRTGQGHAMVATADLMLRRGYRRADAWYLRAVGHLLNGQQIEAVGDVRIAAALESDLVFQDSSRFVALARFQGPLRIHLERLAALGPSASLAR